MLMKNDPTLIEPILFNSNSKTVIIRKSVCKDRPKNLYETRHTELDPVMVCIGKLDYYTALRFGRSS